MLKDIHYKIYRFLTLGNRAARLWRLANLAELRLRRQRLLSYPPFLSIDPAPYCNLHCPCCPTGSDTSKLTKEPLQPEVFEAIVRNLRLDRVAHASLYRIGESLLNPHLPRFIKYFAERKIATAISINFSARDYDDAYMEEIVRSGLDEFTVSVDGMTQETYEMYRRGGNLARVIENTRRLAAVKRRMRANRPRIVFKMLLNKFNQDQVDDARKLAAELNAEFYQPHFFWAPGEEWTADKFKQMYGDNPQSYVATDERHRYVDTECRQLWDTLHVHSNGDVLPCCMAVEHKFAVGNLTHQPIGEIWNNHRMRTLRRYVVQPDAPKPDFDNPCEHCERRFCTYWK
jgi:radical SAM protein with 4Fe4S-binding SPASM domain